MGDALVWAIKNGEVDECKKLCKEVDINSELTLGRMALHIAADYGHVDVLEYLISQGANVNVEDKHGITPLLAAIFEGHESCCKLLINKGANKNGKAPSGESYMEAAESDAIKELLK